MNWEVCCYQIFLWQTPVPLFCRISLFQTIMVKYQIHHIWIISAHYKKRILGECLLISSLPGKVLRTLVDIARLAERFNMRSQS